ncbi:hypothetical protein LIER_25876 [Lithospermum erythrorhizon]|uniref:Uncharacterized protein n=1 Tax=Lithospermum erythrorhizon TaxID=34254 RepID=A0AAV3R8H4_LITER
MGLSNGHAKRDWAHPKRIRPMKTTMRLGSPRDDPPNKRIPRVQRAKPSNSKINPNREDNHPQGDNALNLNNPAAQRPEDAPPGMAGLIHIGSRRTLPKGGSSYPPGMAGLIQRLTDQIARSVMDHLRERLPHLRRETPAVSSFVREETYMAHPPIRTNNEPLPGQQNHYEAPVPGTAAPTQATDAVTLLQKQIEALTKRVTGKMRRGTNNAL